MGIDEVLEEKREEILRIARKHAESGAITTRHSVRGIWCVSARKMARLPFNKDILQNMEDAEEFIRPKKEREGR